MTKLVNVDALEFETIKKNIKDFLRGQREFSDYDFEGSAMSTLIDILAYNTHYNAIYTNLMLNESFLDSASKYSSVVSLAKSIGYTAKSVKSAAAKLRVTVSGVPVLEPTMTLPKGTAFRSVLGKKEFTFYTIGAYTAPLQGDRYVFDIDVYEGLPVTNFYVNSDGVQFIIPNRNADTTTLRVTVQESISSSALSQFYQTTDLITLTKDSYAFFIKQREDLFYEVFFGNGVIGRAINPGNVVYLDYIVANGAAANGCSQFFYSSGFRGDVLYTVTTTTVAIGGADEESINSIKHNAPRNYISQNRAVTAIDYENQILSHFPQVETVSAWGGQDNDPPVYGKVFLAVKPYGRNALTDLEKKQINEFLSTKRSVLSVQQTFVDPTVIEIALVTNIYYNPNATTRTEGEIAVLVKNAIKTYGKSLNGFESTFRFSKLTSVIDSADPSIVSNISKITLCREVKPVIGASDRYHFSTGNPIFNKEGSVKSSRIYVPNYDTHVTIQNDSAGVLWIYQFNQDGTPVKTTTRIGTVDLAKGTIDIPLLTINDLYDPVFMFYMTPSSNDVVPIRQNLISLPGSRLTINMISDQTSYGLGGNNFVFSESR